MSKPTKKEIHDQRDVVRLLGKEVREVKGRYYAEIDKLHAMEDERGSAIATEQGKKP
jgi:hypothetical protein